MTEEKKQRDETYMRSRLEKQRRHTPFDVEQWYPVLKAHTFATEFLPLEPSEARSIIRYYRQRYCSDKRLTREDCVRIYSLKARIDETIKTNPKLRKNGNFVRLSSRSPKDGTPLKGNLIENYKEELRSRIEGTHSRLDIFPVVPPIKWDSEDPNTKAAAAFEAQERLLRVSNGNEALNLICTSERAYMDLLLAVDCLDYLNRTDKFEMNKDKKIIENESPQSGFKMNLILREWDPRVKGSLEFRCFVSGNKLRAISQYNHYCYFPFLESFRSEIVRSCCAKFEEVKELLAEAGYSNYVIDFAMVPKRKSNEKLDGTEWECIVIELNPFEKSTGAGLFSWTTDINLLSGTDSKGNPTSEKDVPLRLHEKSVTGIERFVEGILLPQMVENQNTEAAYTVLLDEVLEATRSHAVCVVC